MPDKDIGNFGTTSEKKAEQRGKSSSQAEHGNNVSKDSTPNNSTTSKDKEKD